MSEILLKISTAVIEGRFEGIEDMTKSALDEGISPKEIMDDGLMVGMDHVGVEFKAANMFIPEVMRSARVMQSAMNVIKPLLSEADTTGAGKVILGTVEGDLHNIGKNLVAMMCEGAGFEIIDVGEDLSPGEIVEAVKEHVPDVLGLSAMLTTTMNAMQETIKALEDAGLRDKVKVIIGGAPVTQSYSDQIGADGYSPDATSAADLVKTMSEG